MYEGLLVVNEQEIVNAARAKAYISAFMPAMRFDCDEVALDSLATVFGPYSTPVADGAPWVRPGVPESQDFYGFYPAKVEGGSDSTYSLSSTELIIDGGVFGTSRNASRETRWTIVGFAKDEAAMEAGLTWLKDALSDECAARNTPGCVQNETITLKAPPRSAAAVSSAFRRHFNVGVTVPPAVFMKKTSKSGVAWTITFTLKSDPFGFTSAQDIGVVSMTTGYATRSDPVGQNCSLQNAGYKDFINDPFFTAISLPPQPPVVKPPNLLPVPVWRRKTITIPDSMSKHGQTAAPIVKVVAASVLRQLRMRVYDVDVNAAMTDCNYVGEFYVSYLPAGSSLEIDCARKEAFVTLASGVVTSGSHLLFGSDGNPYLWPDLECEGKFTIAIDMMPPTGGANANISIDLKVMTRD